MRRSRERLEERATMDWAAAFTRLEVSKAWRSPVVRRSRSRAEILLDPEIDHDAIFNARRGAHA